MSSRKGYKAFCSRERSLARSLSVSLARLPSPGTSERAREGERKSRTLWREKLPAEINRTLPFSRGRKRRRGQVHEEEWKEEERERERRQCNRRRRSRR